MYSIFVAIFFAIQMALRRSYEVGQLQRWHLREERKHAAKLITNVIAIFFAAGLVQHPFPLFGKISAELGFLFSQGLLRELQLLFKQHFELDLIHQGSPTRCPRGPCRSPASLFCN